MCTIFWAFLVACWEICFPPPPPQCGFMGCMNQTAHGADGKCAACYVSGAELHDPEYVERLHENNGQPGCQWKNAVGHFCFLSVTHTQTSEAYPTQWFCSKHFEAQKFLSGLAHKRIDAQSASCIRRTYATTCRVIACARHDHYERRLMLGTNTPVVTRICFMCARVNMHNEPIHEVHCQECRRLSLALQPCPSDSDDERDEKIFVARIIKFDRLFMESAHVQQKLTKEQINKARCTILQKEDYWGFDVV